MSHYDAHPEDHPYVVPIKRPNGTPISFNDALSMLVYDFGLYRHADTISAAAIQWPGVDMKARFEQCVQEVIYHLVGRDGGCHADTVHSDVDPRPTHTDIKDWPPFIANDQLVLQNHSDVHCDSSEPCPPGNHDRIDDPTGWHDKCGNHVDSAPVDSIDGSCYTDV